MSRKLNIFKLIVQDSESCVKLLRYLNKQIETINKLGAGVVIEKIEKSEFDAEMVESLRKKGITRLPALVAPDNKKFIGYEQITELFEKNISSAKKSSVGDAADGASVYDHWMKTLYSGEKNGKFDDSDEEDDNRNDIQRRMAHYQRNIPKHRREDGGRKSAPKKTAREPTRPAARERDYDDEEYEDNIADEDYPEERRDRIEMPEMSGGDDARGDELDKIMLAAYLENS